MPHRYDNCWMEIQLDNGLGLLVNYDFVPGAPASFTEDGYPEEIYIRDLKCPPADLQALGLTEDYLDEYSVQEEIYRKIYAAEEAAKHRDDSGAYPPEEPEEFKYWF